MTARKEDLEVSQKKKAECDARAQAIVYELIDGIKTEEEFLEQLRWVNQNHYQDVVEERAISKLCGYPVCEEKLDIMPQKKYHISVSRKKVYDITERKLFCSNQCYKASTYLKMQLHTSPLWLGNREEVEAFSLWKSRTELIGTEVNFEIESVKIPPNHESEGVTPSEVDHIESESYVSYTLREDLEFCAEDEMDSEIDDGQNEFDDENLEPSSKLEKNVLGQEFRDTKLVENHSTSDSDSKINRTDLSSESTRKIHLDSNESESVRENDCYAPAKSKSIGTKSTKLKKSESPSPKISNESLADLVNHVELSMREWITVESVQFILGEQAVVNLLMSRVRDENYREKEPELYAHYTSLCNRLKIGELNEEGNSIHHSSSSHENIQLLTKEFEDMKMKVKAFYRGDKRVTFDENVKEASIDLDETRPIGCMTPYYQYNQLVIRRKIVLQKLNFVLPDLCDVLALNRVDISSKVKQLVSKCTFEAHNITFKPLQWSLIALIFLKLLAVENHHISTSFQDRSKLIFKLLSSYELEPEYLDLLTSRLTDLDSVLKLKTAS